MMKQTGSFHRKGYLMQHYLSGATIQVATEDNTIIVMYYIELFGPAHGILVHTIRGEQRCLDEQGLLLLTYT